MHASARSYVPARNGLFVAAMALGIAACLFAPTADAILPYILTDLGTLGGDTCYANAINNLGQVVGYGEDADGYITSFLWLPEPAYGLPAGMNDLIAGYRYPWKVWDINDSGQIAGNWLLPKGLMERPCLWEDNIATDLPLTFPDGGNMALGINESGLIVGEAKTGIYKPGGEETTHAWVVDTETMTMTDLGAPTTYGSSQAYDVNASGQIVGSAKSACVRYQAVLWEGDEMTYLGILGGSTSLGRAINDAGQVVGTTMTGPGGWDTMHAFLWQDGIMTDLGTLAGGDRSLGYDINESGQVIGAAATSGRYSYHAFVWEDGEMHDLNDLVVGGSSWTLEDARCINDRGQIVAIGMIGGEAHAFLLTPIPEPGTLTLAVLGALGLLIGRTKKR